MSSRQEAVEGERSAFESLKLRGGGCRRETVTGHKGGDESVCCMSIQMLSQSRASIQVKASLSARRSLQQQTETDYREGRVQRIKQPRWLLLII